MSAGVPVVATDVGGVADLVVPERTGWLVPRQDPQRLAAAIAHVLASPGEAAARAEEGRRFVLERHTAAGLLRRTEALYAGLLAAG